MTHSCRCVGITLISLQRYATVCLNGNSRGKIISEIPSPLYVMVHWTTAILLISPICTSFHSYYNSPNTLDIVNPPEMLALASLMMFVAVVVFFSISMVCYAHVFFHILHYNYFTNSVNSQELRLCIQATGLLVAFVLLFFYHVGQFVINHLNDLPLLFTWRLFHPLVTGFVSFSLFQGSVVSAAKPPSRFVLPAIDEKKLSTGAK
nr:7TM GPCR domain containing protein [Haemonchus contortus]